MNSQAILQEYQKIQGGRGYIIQPHWHVLEISGKDRVRFLHNLLSQNVEEQAVGERRWTTLLNSKGRLIGFFQVWKLKDTFLLLIHDSHKEAVYKTLDMYLITEDVTFKWLEDRQIVSTFVPSRQKLLEGYPYQPNKIVEENILRCEVDDFSVPGVQMILTPDQIKTVTASAVEISKDLFEAIRIESGFPMPGVDYTDPIPLEIPFMHRAVSFTKGCYVGQETIARLHARGLNVSKKLLPFSCEANAEISTGNPVLMEEVEVEVGKVTSISFSPDGDKKIGLVWIHRKAFGHVVTVNGKNIEVRYG